MTTKLLLKKLRVDHKKFITRDEMIGYCKIFSVDYTTTIKYFIRKGYFIRIFKGIFYIRPFGHISSQNVMYDYMRLVSKGLYLKGIRNWYFGLNSALRLNKMTHEYFTVEYVISDSISRSSTMNIAAHKFKFKKMSKRLFNFGIVRKNGIRYSDAERTILDLMYFKKYEGFSEKRIISDIYEWSRGLSNRKLRDYSKHYPLSVQRMAGELKR